MTIKEFKETLRKNYTKDLKISAISKSVSSDAIIIETRVNSCSDYISIEKFTNNLRIIDDWTLNSINTSEYDNEINIEISFENKNNNIIAELKKALDVCDCNFLILKKIEIWNNNTYVYFKILNSK